MYFLLTDYLYFVGELFNLGLNHEPKLFTYPPKSGLAQGMCGVTIERTEMIKRDKLFIARLRQNPRSVSFTGIDRAGLALGPFKSIKGFPDRVESRERIFYPVDWEIFEVVNATR